jgi:hypothetical protein
MMLKTRRFAGVAAFICGAVVAIVTLFARQDLSAAPAIFVHTCAATDGTLRYSEATVPCGPDERRIRITVPGKKDPECNDDKQRVQKLENRLKDLENRDRMGTLRGRRVKAPFEVVTKDGGRLLRIEEQNVTFYNRDRKPVVWILADASGGMLQAQTVDGAREVTLAAQDARSHLAVKEQGNVRVDVGRRAVGRYSTQFFGATGKQVAALGQSEAGSGILLVGDGAGTTKVSMHINRLTNGGTRVEVANAPGEVVGWMSAASGGGQLRILTADGVVKAEAGLTVDDVGVVRTFPGNCHSGVGILGVIPDCILGRRP